MTTVSPPKPWERASSAASAPSTPTASTMTASGAPTTLTSAPTSTTQPPTLPDRPNTLNNVVNQTASNYSPYGQNRFGVGVGTNPYSAYSSYGSYSSPYSRFGGMGMGGMYGGGYGYGGMGMGGMGGMYGGMGMGGMPGDPNNPQSLTQAWNTNTAQTFQMMESIVGAFGGFAQMLESAYMTTHSSFFAMVSMAEQLGNLRQTLGSVLGIYTLLRWLRTLIAKLTGRPPPADATALTPTNFSSFLNGGKGPTTLPDGSPAPPRASRKPFIMFAIAVFGLPYLMSKLIRSMARSQEEEMKRQQELALTGGYANPNGEPLDPRKLDFCRVLYDYTPASQSTGMDLEVKKGDLVAVLSKTDPMGNASEWWRCRARDGKVGYLPSPYLQTLQRKPAQAAITAAGEAAGSVSAPGSRTTTLKGSDFGLNGDSGRTKSMSSVIGVTPGVKGGPGDISAESFQKSAFYQGP